MDKKNLIEKIKKLLALATSSNEHEAKLAAEKAQELMLIHNLEMRDVQKSMNDYDIKKSEGTGRPDPADKFVDNILVKFFFVSVVSVRNKKTRTSSYDFVGEKTNLEIAMYVRDFLHLSFKQCFKAYAKENGKGKRARESYYFGLYNGLCAQLEAARTRFSEERGLVVSNRDPNLHKAVTELSGPTRGGGNYRVRAGDQHAQDSGYETGKNLHIARGIAGGVTDSGKLLG